jgi:alkylation response protein AidB-like acyl-CoA dehydrogenase
MVDLGLTDAQEMLRNNAHRFLLDKCSREVVREIDESKSGFSASLWKDVSDMGWPSIVIDERYGGMGSSLTDAGVLFEEMGWACMPSPLLSSSVLCALAIQQGGSAAQKEQYLPLIADGNRIVAFAFAEPTYGWSPESITVRAAQRGDEYLLSGTKLFVPDAGIADSYLIVARTGSGGADGSGLTLFLADKGTPGIAIREISGWTGAKLYEITLEKVALPAAAIVGEVNHGYEVIAPVIDKGTSLLCAYMLGGLQQMGDMAIAYSQSRIAFGVPISTFQRVQDMIITIVNDTEAVRWTTYEALSAIDNGAPERDVAEAVSVAKIVASEGFTRGTENAHYVHGGVSVDMKYGLYLYTKQSRTLFSYLGDPAYHKKRVARIMFDS